MKVTNWRRKLAASLVAGGLLMPGAATGANLDVNLVIDPGFEDVDAGSPGAYGALPLNSWMDGSDSGFTYAAGQYDNGGPLAGGGARYFSSNQTANGDADAPGEVAQLISVSTGASGTLIASGEAAVSLSGFFTTYLTNGDFGTLHVDFLDSGSVSLGTASIGPTVNEGSWTQHTGGGSVPLGTESLLVSVFGTPVNGGPDGYIDNVDVQITSAANVVMFLEVNTTTGVATLRNETGDAISIDYYEITSPGNSLDPANGTGWNSFQDQNRAGFPAGNGTGNGWEQAGGSDNGVLGESYLTGNSAVAHQGAISLGALYDPGDPQDLVFRYGVVGTVVLTADFDKDGDADGGDFLDWQRGFGTTFDAADLADLLSEYRSTAGPGGTSTLVTGFVRYVSGVAGSAVPEPSSVLLVGAGLSLLCVARRREFA